MRAMWKWALSVGNYSVELLHFIYLRHGLCECVSVCVWPKPKNSDLPTLIWIRWSVCSSVLSMMSIVSNKLKLRSRFCQHACPTHLIAIESFYMSIESGETHAFTLINNHILVGKGEFSLQYFVATCVCVYVCEAAFCCCYCYCYCVCFFSLALSPSVWRSALYPTCCCVLFLYIYFVYCFTITIWVAKMRSYIQNTEPSIPCQ